MSIDTCNAEDLCPQKRSLCDEVEASTRRRSGNWDNATIQYESGFRAGGDCTSLGLLTVAT